jgi:GNAT superfamily N-acetyltransferase
VPPCERTGRDSSCRIVARERARRWVSPALRWTVKVPATPLITTTAAVGPLGVRSGRSPNGRSRISIRPARDDEGPELTDLAVRSKGHWAYGDTFVEAARAELTIGADTIRSSRMYVVEQDGVAIGFYGLLGTPPEGRLEWMFLEPGSIGRGYGRLMLEEALQTATSTGFESLLTESDRYAEPFYVAMGAVTVGSTPSTVDGAPLPLLRFDLVPPQA